MATADFSDYFNQDTFIGPDNNMLGGELELKSNIAPIVEQKKYVSSKTEWKPLPHQIPPTDDNWYGIFLLGGRGSGKSDFCSNWIVEHVKGPPCLHGPAPHWINIIAPTLGDAATSCFAGPSGISAHDPTAEMLQKTGGLIVRWPNGSQAKLLGAREKDDIERLRAAGNSCAVWLEEFAAFKYMQDAWDQMRFGLRSGPHPHFVASSTPKPRPLIKKIAAGGYNNIIVRHATMYDNPHLAESFKEAIEETYGGTTLGAQELYGRIVEQDENALWNRDVIERQRRTVDQIPYLKRIVVGVDPSGGAGEQGIVVVGSDVEIRNGKPVKVGWTLADRTVHMKPEGWGRAAIRAAIDYNADCVVVETNFGGDMAVSTLVTAAEELDASIPIRTVKASRGKHPRAEPVSMLAQQERWYFGGMFEELEDQLCVWTPESDYSPDRLDAMVWPAWYMKLVSTLFSATGKFGGSAMATRSITGSRRDGIAELRSIN